MSRRKCHSCLTKPDGERIVQRPDATLVGAVGAVGLSQATQPEPTTAPAGKIFAGWDTSEVGNGVYPAGAVTFPAGNLRLYAQWTDDTPTEWGARQHGARSGMATRSRRGRGRPDLSSRRRFEFTQESRTNSLLHELESPA